MSPELAKRLALVFPTAAIEKTGVSGVSGVAVPPRYAGKPQEIRPLRPLRLENGNARKMQNPGVAAGVASPIASEIDAIEERAGLAADRVPACYLDAWARLQCQQPVSVSQDRWRCAIDDAGQFLDAWGADAAAIQWGAGELFDVPREGRPGGLVWFIEGGRIDALGNEGARTDAGRIFHR